MFLRRSHLFLGLLLMPWALLYGVSGYLFNHPTHFTEMVSGFGGDAVRGTELEHLPTANSVAVQVVTALNNRFSQNPLLTTNATTPARYEGEFFIATADLTQSTVQILLYRNGTGGRVRIQTKEPRKASREEASFAITPNSQKKPEQSDELNTTSLSNPNSDPLRLDDCIDRVCKNSLPTILERLKIDATEKDFRITTAPETVFEIRERDQIWAVRYNCITGAVSAKAADTQPSRPINWRLSILRLHTAHGFPSEMNARWVWAVIVDVMAFVMVFWGISGIVMWWQIKRTRPWGTVALLVSLTIASLVVLGMLPTLK